MSTGGGIKLADIHADDDFQAIGNGRFCRDSLVDEENMLTTYSMRLSPPFSGQVQIAETERARALTLDGKVWGIQFIHRFVDNSGPGEPVNRRKHVRVATIPHSDMARISEQRDLKGRVVDERILELTRPLASVELPFPAGDAFEYWLLDAEDGSPLAFLFSCTDAAETEYYDLRPEWTALPASLMPVDKTDDEMERGDPPVNCRFERLVTERAGINPKARWFHRSPASTDDFPPLLVKEDWREQQQQDLCQRYLQRQAPRLLMLHSLEYRDRLRLEQAARPNVLELARFYPLYPDVADKALMNAMRVEARLRQR